MGGCKSKPNVGEPTKTTPKIQPLDEERPITHPMSQEPKRNPIQDPDDEDELGSPQKGELDEQGKPIKGKKGSKKKKPEPTADRSINLSQELPELGNDEPRFNFNGGDLSPIGEEDEPKAKPLQTFSQKVAGKEKDIEKKEKGVSNHEIVATENEINNDFASMGVGERRFQPETQQMRAGKKVTIQEPIQIKEIEQPQPEPKKIRPRRDKLGIFDWPPKGEVQLKTIAFKLRYNIGLKSFKVIKSNDKYTTSSLQWEQDDVGYYECTLTDLFTTTLKTGNSVEINLLPLKFVIDINGKFVEITNEEELLDQTINAQTKKIPITQNLREKMRNSIKQEFLKTWKALIGMWINMDQNRELITGETKDSGKDCFLLNKTISFSDEQLRTQMMKSLKDKDAYYRLLSSKKIIKNKMKHWELDRDSSSMSLAQQIAYAAEKGDARFTKEYFDQKHRSIKANFLQTDRFENFSAIAEAREMLRPHYASYEGAKKIVVDLDSDLYIDIEQEMLQVMVFWPDLHELASDDNLVSVMTDFRDGCYHMMEDLVKETSKLPKVPLEYKLKRSEEVDAIVEKLEEHVEEEMRNNSVNPQ